MFTEVIKAEYIDGYRIKLWFNNHVTKVVDLKSSLQGVVLEWENGADFAPEYLLELPEA